jgi:hypothetical protein
MTDLKYSDHACHPDPGINEQCDGIVAVAARDAAGERAPTEEHNPHQEPNGEQIEINCQHFDELIGPGVALDWTRSRRRPETSPVFAIGEMMGLSGFVGSESEYIVV